MSLLKKYQLNENYFLEVCSRFDEAALNGEVFNAKEEWVIKEYIGENTSPFYTTMAAKKFNIILKTSSPLLAIQQIVSYAYTGKEKKLKNMWFRILKY